MPDTEESQPDESADDTEEVFDADRAKAKITKVNQEARSLRERLRVAEEKAKRLDELEESGKSELQKLTDQLAEAQKAAQEAEQRAWRAEVAAEKGLTPAQAKRLVGGSLEELQADADELIETFKPQEGASGDASPVSERPTPQLRGGTDPTEEPVELDPAKLAEAVPRGF